MSLSSKFGYIYYLRMVSLDQNMLQTHTPSPHMINKNPRVVIDGFFLYVSLKRNVYVAGVVATYV